MHDFLIAENSELWDIILDGTYVPTIKVKEGETTRLVPKTRQHTLRQTGRKSRKITRQKN